jgi:carbon-monoxide dehydrogenase medium subunit
MKAAPYRLERAAVLDEALARLQGEDYAKPIAGGQSLGAMLNLRLAQPERLVDLDGIAGLAQAGLSGNELALGAMVTHAAIEDGLGAETTGGFLQHVARRIAYRAVRNRGTVGGSLCHADPAADWVSAMAVAGAQLVIRGMQGERVVPASAFVRSAFECDLEAGELLCQIRIPAFSPGARWSYRKFCRKTGEFALAIVGALRDPERGVERLVLGGLDGAPQVFDEPGLFARLGDAAQREVWLAAAAPGLDALRQTLLADLLSTVLQDIEGGA